MSRADYSRVPSPQANDYRTFTDEDAPERVSIFPSHRLVVILLCLMSNICGSGAQALIGASVLTMTNTMSGNDTDHEDQLGWRHNWTDSTQSWIISSYFAGYYAMQFPAGWLTVKIGGTTLVFFSALTLVMCQILTIPISRLGPVSFAIVMFLGSLVNACLFPGTCAVSAKWVPSQEASRLQTLNGAGLSIGLGFAYLLSSFTSRVQVIGGWPFNHITIGTILILLAVLWRVMVTDTPEVNGKVKPAELRYIQSGLVDFRVKDCSNSDIPWRSILTSPPVWAIVSTQFGVDWLIYCFLSIFPRYLVKVHGMDLTTVGMLSGLPWFCVLFPGYLVSKTVDHLREKGVPTALLRKICDFIAKPMAALLLLVASFLPDHQRSLVAALYAMSIVMLCSFCWCSSFVNVPELSTEYVGAIWIVNQLVSMIAPVIAPVLFTSLTPNNTPDEWRLCFGITVAICAITCSIYVIFGTSRQQDWGSARAERERSLSSISHVSHASGSD